MYPTPPPPGISTSSSSLAHALGEPPKPHKIVHRPSESAKFFDSFLAQQAAQQQRPRTPHRPTYSTPKESPDPLAFSSPPLRTLTVTPRKRKAVPPLESSSVKRPHANEVAHIPSACPPRDETPSLNVTPTPKQKLQVYVELPPVPKSHRTPSRSQSQVSSRRVPQSDDDDLGGFGSDDMHGRRTDRQHSSGRAGDELGTSAYILSGSYTH